MKAKIQKPFSIGSCGSIGSCPSCKTDCLKPIQDDYNKMNYLTCDCVWCVLTRKDFQCCGVLIKVSKKNNKGDVSVNVVLPDDYEGEKNAELLNDIANLGVGIFRNEPLKRGDVKHYEKDNCHANVECIRKFKWYTCYYLCFHADLPEDTEDEEPTNTQ